MSEAQTTRKAVGRATSSRERVRLPLLDVRKRMWEQACELATAGESRRLTSILANRFGTSEPIVERCLLAEGMRHERVAATLRNGIANAVEMAREVSTSAEELFLAA